MERKFLALLCVLVAALPLRAQTTAITYQGSLSDGGKPANGSYDVAFALYDASVNGNLIATVTNSATTVTGGLFTAVLDFGPGVFGGLNYWLELSVRTNGGNDFTTVAPRQAVTSTPYAIQAANAVVAASALAAGSVSGTNISGMIPDAQLSANVAMLNGSAAFAGAVTATNFTGNGTGLTNVPGAVAWQVVSGTNQQAVSNYGFLLTNGAGTTLTLPASPNVGDVVYVCGTGAGGWTLAQNAGQSVHSSGGFSSYTPWTSRGTVMNWAAVASSADGSHLAAVNTSGPGYVYVSADAGMTWNQALSLQFASAIASSADGTKLAGVGNNAIYTSSDSGLGWTPVTAPVQTSWHGVLMSTDGTRILLVPATGYFYYSPDSGADWIQRTSLSGSWAGAAWSTDGKKVVAAMRSESVFTSTNSGVTWSQHGFASQPLSGLASSADGTRLVAVGAGTPIYTSGDSGATWTAQNSGSLNWNSVASSADGTHLVATVTAGLIYTSVDSGVTWMAQNSGSRNWSGVACSADGTRLVAVVSNGYIYTSQLTSVAATTSGASGYLTGRANATVGLLYTGSGSWVVINGSSGLFAF